MLMEIISENLPFVESFFELFPIEDRCIKLLGIGIIPALWKGIKYVRAARKRRRRSLKVFVLDWYS